MQSSNFRPRFTAFPKPQTATVYQRPMGPPLPALFKGEMDVPSLLDARNRAAIVDEMRLYQHQSMQMNGETGYGLSQGSTLGHHQQAMQQPHGLPYTIMAPSQHSPLYAPSYMSRHDSQSTLADENFGATRPKNGTATKSFHCSSCGKAFARRSDLARHERIHSGNRPHTCDFPGCGKSFIQRSALTVHNRVHTGEKPHMCNHCSKPFSDSSSLARHRRIHSGTRPYKCEYANCQKTFTRRTTLTRHQNQHAGTVEQAAAEVNAKLATTRPQSRSLYSSTSGGSSRNSIASPAERKLSISPNSELPPMGTGMQRQGSDYGYNMPLTHSLPPTHLLPPHIRSDFQQSSARSTSPLNGHSLQNYTSAPQQRPITSHPTTYGPPQPLEPPANGTASGGASPHLGNLTWASPGTGTLPPPSTMDGFSYPDPGYGGHHLFYPNGMGRPQSTEPKDYGLHTETKDYGLHTETKEYGLHTAPKNYGLQSDTKDYGLHTAPKNYGPQTDTKDYGLHTAPKNYGLQTDTKDYDLQSHHSQMANHEPPESDWGPMPQVPPGNGQGPYVM